LALEWANPKFAPNKNGGKNDQYFRLIFQCHGFAFLKDLVQTKKVKADYPKGRCLA